ncbi:MAG TPA: FAD-binding protein, partial [Thermodesulfobacteriota bacterium]|nr:FAD-binding protein [Thermodesulfobacteriota bacterium]
RDGAGSVSAALYLDMKDGEWKAIRCGAAVLATGGYEELWAFNDAASTACGDGIFLAYEAGARLVDMEMLQYYPTVVIDPPSIQGTLFQYELITSPEVLGGRLVNGNHQPFFEGALLRDAVIRAMWKEIREGRGSPHGGAFIDLVHSTKTREELTAALEKWQPNQFRYLKEMGCDLRDVLVEVSPHAHFTMGGVAIDDTAATTVPGLFAAGEVAGNLHGANRVSGNALAETQVFGAIAGASAARFAREKGSAGAVDIAAEMERGATSAPGLGRDTGPVHPLQTRRDVRKIVWEKCGVERDAEGLKKGISELSELSKTLPGISLAGYSSGRGRSYPQEVQDCVELEMMIAVADLVLRSALFRPESRGHHVRTDYPETNREAAHTFICKGKEPWAGPVRRIHR